MSKKIITLHVNGKDREVAVDERESLYETLRNELRLTSIKKGCEVAVRWGVQFLIKVSWSYVVRGKWGSNFSVFR